MSLEQVGRVLRYRTLVHSKRTSLSTSSSDSKIIQRSRVRCLVCRAWQSKGTSLPLFFTHLLTMYETYSKALYGCFLETEREPEP